MGSRVQRWVESSAVVVFPVFAPLALWRLGVVVDSAAAAGILVLCALAAWAVADFFSGLVHWAGDTWGSVRTPFFGRAFIFPFREHHVDPQAMTRHDFVEVNGACCVASAPVLVWTALAPVAELAVHGFLVFLSLGVLATNQCHKWAHTAAAKRPRVVRLLQRLRIILPPDHHRRHHIDPYDTHYCTASGWMNRPLNAIGFFRGLEAVGRAFGGQPRPLDPDPLGEKS